MYDNADRLQDVLIFAAFLIGFASCAFVVFIAKVNQLKWHKESVRRANERALRRAGAR